MPAVKKSPRSAKTEPEIVPAVPLEPVAPAPVAPVIPVIPVPMPVSEKPGMVQTIAIMTLVNGIINILWGGLLTLSLMPTLVCWPFGAFPLVLGILEVIYAAKILPSQLQPVQPSKTIAIMEIIAILYMNPLSMIGGILALVFYGDPAVKAYFAKINSQAVG
jgi:hypothetical protein